MLKEDLNFDDWKVGNQVIFENKKYFIIKVDDQRGIIMLSEYPYAVWLNKDSENDVTLTFKTAHNKLTKI